MSDEPKASAGKGRGRRPSAEVRARIVAAAGELLFEQGIRAVTFDRVASVAGSSKMTVYKWWPSPGALAAEAFFARSEPILAFPDSGDVRTDVRAQLRAFVRLLTEEGAGRAISELIGAAQSDPDLQAAISASYTRPRRALAVEAFQRAKDRGQLRKGLDLQLLVDQLWGACYNRLLVPDAPLDVRFADALVDNALLGAASTGYREAGE